MIITSPKNYFIAKVYVCVCVSTYCAPKTIPTKIHWVNSDWLLSLKYDFCIMKQAKHEAIAWTLQRIQIKAEHIFAVDKIRVKFCFHCTKFHLWIYCIILFWGIVGSSTLSRLRKNFVRHKQNNWQMMANLRTDPNITHRWFTCIRSSKTSFYCSKQNMCHIVV